MRPRYFNFGLVEWETIIGKATELELGLRADAENLQGINVWPGHPVKKENVQVSVAMDNPGNAGGARPILFICILYDSPGFDDPRVTLEAFRMHPGTADNFGFTTEFIGSGVRLKDIAEPLRWVRSRQLTKLLATDLTPAQAPRL